MKALLKSKVFLASAVALAVVGLYALLGFYAAPRLIRSHAIEFVQKQYGRALAIGDVRLNPFTLQLTVDDVALPDADGQPMIGFQRLFVDFEASSLWHRAFVFKAVDLAGPSVRVVIRPGGAVNLADLAPPAPAQKPQEPSPPPRLWIQALDVHDGRAQLVDRARSTPLERSFAPIAFSLKDFRTMGEGGDFHLVASSERAEGIDWKGRFALVPAISSQGEIALTGVRAPGIAELLGDALPFGLSSGHIDLAGHYQLSLGGDATQLQVELPTIDAKDLRLRARGVDADWIEVPDVAITDTRLALPAHSVGLGAVKVTGLKAQAWRDKDGAINLTRLFASGSAPTAATSGPAAPPATPADGAAGEPAQPWQVRIGRVELANATVGFEDRTVAPAAQFSVTPIDVSLEGLSLDLAQPLPVTFDARINGRGTLKGTGRVTPSPLAADLDFTLENFDLRDVQSYVATTTAMTIRGGSFGARGKVTLAPPGGKGAELGFAGDVEVTKFHSIDNALEQDFFNVERLQVAKIRYTKSPDALTVDSVRVVKPFARVIMASNGVVNVSAVLDPQGTAAALEARQADTAAKAAAAEADARKSRAQRRAEEKAARADAAARARAPRPPAPELKETGMPIRVAAVRVDGGELDFEDFSVQPNFHAQVQSLHGSVTGLSSDPKSRAKVELEGNVGEYSPVTIAGTVQPFAYDRYTDIGLKFENISLPVFNPYSGKYAGYNIARGKLTTELHYLITNRKLEAQHHVRIDQLEWGEATAEKGEATLPVKFATSLLKDVNGVIDLELPVSGTLDDPSFRIGPIVWKIVKNLIVKVVAAPFKALGALFKGAEEAQFVDFAPGSASLDPALAERLAALGKSLAAKPSLSLDVPLGAVADLDLPALQEARYQAELQRSMDKVLRGKKGGEAPLPAFDTLNDDRKIEVLSALDQRLSGAKPKVPPAPEPPAGTSRKDRKALERKAEIEFLEKDVRSRITLGTSELDELAKTRADAIQKALLADTGLPPQRVFVTKGGKVSTQDGKVRFELGVK